MTANEELKMWDEIEEMICRMEQHIGAQKAMGFKRPGEAEMRIYESKMKQFQAKKVIRVNFRRIVKEIYGVEKEAV